MPIKEHDQDRRNDDRDTDDPGDGAGRITLDFYDLGFVSHA